jgi:methyl-accepting chemotaxis protein
MNSEHHRGADTSRGVGEGGLDDQLGVKTRKDFLAFGPDDAERLRRLGTILAPHADRIIDAMYEHFLRFREPASHLPDDATVRRLKDTQKAYFARLFEGPHDQAYVRERLNIGLAHVRVGLKPEWYVGAYNMYLRLVVEVLVESFRSGVRSRWAGARGADDLIKSLQAVMKVMSFDMGLAIDAYVTTLVQKQQEEQRAAQHERDELKRMVGRVGEVVGHLAAASEELSASSRQLRTNSEEATRQAGAVSAASEQTDQNVQSVATAAEEMTATIKEISKNVQEATRVTAQAVQISEGTNRTIGKLGESSAEIGKVIKVITSIAQQTNLLALNATIEAARAGEAGKGFAVVANEVKELAKETAKATEEIGRKIEAIQADTQGAVTAIGEIGAVIGQINEIATTIAGAVEEQAATTTEISRSVAEAARGTGEVVGNIAGVETASRNTTEGAANVLAASQSLAKMAAELDGMVAEVRDRDARRGSSAVRQEVLRRAA